MWLIHLYIHQWLYNPLPGSRRVLSFIILYRRNQPIKRSLPTHRIRKSTETFMPRVGFELTTPAFKRAKTVHASHCAATVIGFKWLYCLCLYEGLHNSIVFPDSLDIIQKLEVISLYLRLCGDIWGCIILNCIFKGYSWPSMSNEKSIHVLWAQLFSASLNNLKNIIM
jgi:hypothetical protein